MCLATSGDAWAKVSDARLYRFDSLLGNGDPPAGASIDYRPLVRPRSLRFGIPGANMTLRRLRWRRWGTPVAKATGRIVLNVNMTPTQRGRVKVRLTDLERVPACEDGAARPSVYGRLVLVLPMRFTGPRRIPIPVPDADQGIYC